MACCAAANTFARPLLLRSLKRGAGLSQPAFERLCVRFGLGELRLALCKPLGGGRGLGRTLVANPFEPRFGFTELSIDCILGGSCLGQPGFVLALPIGDLPRGCFHLGRVPLFGTPLCRLGFCKLLLRRGEILLDGMPRQSPARSLPRTPPGARPFAVRQ